MAVAYAALMCLMRTSEMILHPYQPWLSIDRNMIGSLLQNVRFLQEFLEGYSHRGHEEMAGLESQIADMAYAAEDVIESHVLDQKIARSTGSEAKSSTSFSEYIHKVIEDMEDLIENKLMKIKETIGKFEEDPNFVDFSPAVPSRLAPNEQNTLVGSDEKLKKILDILTGQQSNRQTVAIAGMGGIGKTTLARNVYQHPLVKHHFDICAWATISQKYSARKIISEMLSEIGQSTTVSLLGDDERLGEKLYKRLCGNRYLIVLDDFWSIEAWDEVKQLFPDQHNGSRIMITTRLGNVAAHLSSCPPFEMEFLDADRSWELLSEKVFGHHRGCPPELERLGKIIAKNTEGLPLAIVVIGGLLSKSDKTKELWRHVAENLSSIINSEDKEKCLKILYLSYNNLPIHLKPCFLYLAMDLEKSHVDKIPLLIKVWVSEGFVKPKRGKSLEETALEYITDLIDRNLIFVEVRGELGKLEIYGIHDLLRDLCLKEAKKSNLCGVIHVRNPEIPLHTKFMQALLKPKRDIPHALEENGNSRLLRLLGSSYLLDENLQLMNLRFMSFGIYLDLDSKFFSWISLFWNLQTLQIRNILSDKPLSLPPEIWNLPHLRHLECDKCVLPDPPIDKHDSHILENLQTLYRVEFFRCSEEVCRRLPNLKKLQVTYKHKYRREEVEWPSFRLHNLVHLQKLKSLRFFAKSPISSKHLSFPLSLKKLTLCGCRIPWEDMTIVGSLPNLEVLRLLYDACEGQTWCPIEGHFVKLKLLKISHTDLVHWTADKTHFSILEHLILVFLKLEEFPEDFGEHSTLRKIEVIYCRDPTNDWAEQIREQQESFGNEGFEVNIMGRKLRGWLCRKVAGNKNVVATHGSSFKVL